MTRRSAGSDQPPLGVGLVGYAFMGAAHSQAWRTVNAFFDLPRKVDMAALCGRNEGNVRAAADQLGWRRHETDWRRLLERDDVHLVDVCTPGSSHAEISIAALEAGKHVLCEKPLANTVDEARAMAEAAERAAAHGGKAMVGFNYRRLPAASFARRLVRSGRLGSIRHIRAQYLQDWIADPDFPLVWRLRKEEAGSGALGDLGAHIVDLTQFIAGQHITAVSALTETFVKTRPMPPEVSGPAMSSPGSSAPDGQRGAVTVDDCALFLARLDGGAVATYEATRFATGRKNGLWIELNGEKGSLVFDLERLNELQFHDATEDQGIQGFRRILVTEPAHPYMDAWWPPGHLIGYEHSFTHQVRDLVEAIEQDSAPEPGFADGVRVQLVLDAVTRSAGGAGWLSVDVPARTEVVPAP